jgi:hypothetical protein
MRVGFIAQGGGSRVTIQVGAFDVATHTHAATSLDSKPKL